MVIRLWWRENFLPHQDLNPCPLELKVFYLCAMLNPSFNVNYNNSKWLHLSLTWHMLDNGQIATLLCQEKLASLFWLKRLDHFMRTDIISLGSSQQISKLFLFQNYDMLLVRFCPYHIKFDNKPFQNQNQTRLSKNEL